MIFIGVSWCGKAARSITCLASKLFIVFAGDFERLYRGAHHLDSVRLAALAGHGRGNGGVLMLRWYWWRINAWSEISSMTAAFVVSMSLQWVELFRKQLGSIRQDTMITTGATTDRLAARNAPDRTGVR